MMTTIPSAKAMAAIDMWRHNNRVTRDLVRQPVRQPGTPRRRASDNNNNSSSNSNSADM